MNDTSSNLNLTFDPLNVMNLEAFIQSFPEINTHREIMLTLIDTSFALGSTKELVISGQCTLEQKEKYLQAQKHLKDQVNQVLGPRLNEMIQFIVAKKLSEVVDALSKEVAGIKNKR